MKMVRLTSQVIIAILLATAVPTRGATQTRIAASGVTVVSATFRSVQVVVRIRTATLTGACAKAFLGDRWSTDGSEKRVVIIQGGSISINGHSVSSVYGLWGLAGPVQASINRGKAGFVLRIDGAADGDSSAYFALITFDQAGVHERRLYSDLDTHHPTDVTHYYTLTVGP